MEKFENLDLTDMVWTETRQNRSIIDTLLYVHSISALIEKKETRKHFFSFTSMELLEASFVSTQKYTRQTSNVES